MRVPLRYYWLVGCLVLGAFSVKAGVKDSQKGRTAGTPCLTEGTKGRDRVCQNKNIIIIYFLSALCCRYTGEITSSRNHQPVTQHPRIRSRNTLSVISFPGNPQSWQLFQIHHIVLIIPSFRSLCQTRCSRRPPLL